MSLFENASLTGTIQKKLDESQLARIISCIAPPLIPTGIKQNGHDPDTIIDQGTILNRPMGYSDHFIQIERDLGAINRYINFMVGPKR